MSFEEAEDMAVQLSAGMRSRTSALQSQITFGRPNVQRHAQSRPTVATVGACKEGGLKSLARKGPPPGSGHRG